MKIRLLTVNNIEIIGISIDPDNIYLLKEPHLYSSRGSSKFSKLQEPAHVGTGVKPFEGAVDYYKKRVTSSVDVTDSELGAEFMRHLNANTN